MVCRTSPPSHQPDRAVKKTKAVVPCAKPFRDLSLCRARTDWREGEDCHMSDTGMNLITLQTQHYTCYIQHGHMTVM